MSDIIIDSVSTPITETEVPVLTLIEVSNSANISAASNSFVITPSDTQVSITSPVDVITKSVSTREIILSKLLPVLSIFDRPGSGDMLAATYDPAAIKEQLIGVSDPRLTDSRAPTPHNHTAIDVTDLQAAISSNADVISNTAKVSDINHVAVLLPDVDNTSDINKPISTAQQAALDAKENVLGNPAVDGYKLISTAGGVRSWVPDTGGSGGSSIAPMDNLMVATVSALLGAAGHNVASIGDIEIAEGVTLEVADGALWSILT